MSPDTVILSPHFDDTVLSCDVEVDPAARAARRLAKLL